MRNMNEVEKGISLKAIKCAWGYTVLFLFIWTVIDVYKTGNFKDSIAFFLLITQNLVLLGVQMFSNRKLGRVEK